MPITESAARLPGWTLIRGAQKGNRYRAPDGTEVGQWAYATALKQYQKTGLAPQSPVGENWKRFQKGAGSSTRNSPVYEELVTEIPIGDDGSISLELPDIKSTPSRRTKSGLFSARELSQGASTILVIVTSLLAVASKMPEAQMTEQEVRAICIPLGNIIERSRFNKVVGAAIVDKSDYLTMGYALYVYIERVSTTSKERRLNTNAQSTGYAQQPQPSSGLNGYSGASSGIQLPVTPAGIRHFTGGL